MNSDEQVRILKMVEDGSINAKEAAELLDALKDAPQDETPQGIFSGRKIWKKKLKILVVNGETGKPKVNIKIPLGLAKWVERFIPADAKQEMEQQGISLDEIFASLDETFEERTLVDVTDETTGDHVLISIE